MKHTMMFAAIAVVTLAVQANPTQISNGVLVSKEGKTLYLFDKDAAGKSNCNGGCAAAWPPFVVANAALAGGDFSIVKRDDGTSQCVKGIRCTSLGVMPKRATPRRNQRRGGRAPRLFEEDIVPPNTSYSAATATNGEGRLTLVLERKSPGFDTCGSHSYILAAV